MLRADATRESCLPAISTASPLPNTAILNLPQSRTIVAVLHQAVTQGSAFCKDRKIRIHFYQLDLSNRSQPPRQCCRTGWTHVLSHEQLCRTPTGSTTAHRPAHDACEAEPVAAGRIWWLCSLHESPSCMFGPHHALQAAAGLLLVKNGHLLSTTAWHCPPCPPHQGWQRPCWKSQKHGIVLVRKVL